MDDSSARTKESGGSAGGPFLSLILPTYARNALTQRALRSVLLQGIGRIEIIVVDDASPVPFTPPADLASDNVTLLRHERNRGAAAARNTGMAAARGDWITFLDSDDMLMPDTLKARLERAIREPRKADDRLTIHACAFIDLDYDWRPLRVREPHASRTPADFASGCWYCPGSCILARREELLSVAGLQREELRRLEDLDWLLNAARADGRLVVDPVVGAAIRVSRPASAADVVAAAEDVGRLWSDGRLDRRSQQRLAAYLDLERAAAAYREGGFSTSFYRLAGSFARVPRLSLQLSPGWRTRPVDPALRTELAKVLGDQAVEHDRAMSRY